MVDRVALAEAAEAIRRLVASGAMDPAVAVGLAHMAGGDQGPPPAPTNPAALGDPAPPSGAGKNGERVTVYQSVTAAGKTQYAGITNSLARRAAEQLRDKGIKIEKLIGGLSRSDARAVEQALIEIHGLEKNGGMLLNQINSIARTNPTYAQQLQRGYELLRSIGYK